MIGLSLINKYIAKRIIGGVFIAFMVVTGIILLIDFVEATRNLGQDLVRYLFDRRHLGHLF